LPENVCLPEPTPGSGSAAAPAQGGRRRVTLIIIILGCAAAVPLGLIRAGMSPAAALTTAGAVAAFAVGVTHQVLGLLASSLSRGAGPAVTADELG
jgi:hypothetical protein